MSVRLRSSIGAVVWVLALSAPRLNAEQPSHPVTAGTRPVASRAAADAAETVTGRSQAYRFAGTRWGASAEQTKTHLADHGFRFERADEDGDLIFTGTLNDHPALVMALLADDQLTKVLVSLPANDETAMSIYREIKGVLNGQYGAPKQDLESYEYPFADGKHVGFESAALRVGKAVVSAYWLTNGEALGLNISKELVVSAHYESPWWKEEAERRVKRAGP
jgi:hypothetical protein